MANGHRGEIALVTGANKGIGRQIARRLAQEGMTVYIGCRDEERGRAAARELSGGGGDIRFVHLDVTDQGHVDRAVRTIADESDRLDVLVNNAGVVVEWGTDLVDVTAEQVRRTYEVNVFGIVAVTRACLPLLRRSAGARVVNLSSPLGSLGLLSDPHSLVAAHGMLAYSSSKAAVNALTLLYANALRKEGIAVNAVNPGYVATDLNGHRGVLTVEQGAEVPVMLALAPPGGPTATFIGHAEDGSAAQPVPW